MITFGNCNWKLATSIAILGAVFSTINTAHAQQVVPDNTLPNNSVVNLENNITNITGGTQRGGNLFHSFERFGVDTGSEVFFNNNDNISNIINRVTGGNRSDIDGLIRANGSANLFLINPNGIVFRENARLDIGGSFIGSTADAIWFGENNFFSAINPENTPLLSVNVPLGLQYGANPGDISVTGTGAPERNIPEFFDTEANVLEVKFSKTLALIGGNVSLKGAALRVESGRIELGSVAESGVVSIEAVEKGFSFGFGELENFGEIELSEITAVDASENGAGDVLLTGRNLTLTDSSVISSTQTRTNKSVGIVVNTTESVEINGENDTFIASGLYANNVSENVEETGNITINTQQLTVRDGATVTTNAFNGAAKGGDINIAANNFRIESGARVSASTFTTGDGGNLNINAENVEVIGTSNNGNTPTQLSANAERGSTGDAGDLNITTNNLRIEGGAFISGNTFGAGNGAIVKINSTSENATSKVEVVGRGGNENQFPSGIFVTAEPSDSSEVPSTGNAGSLTVNTKQMIVRDGGFVSTSTNSRGDGGGLNINATDSLQVLNDGTKVIAGTSNEGEGGNLKITTDSLRIENGAEVSVGASATGNGGDLTIHAKAVEVIGMANITPSKLTVQTNAETDSKGNAGNLIINTQTLTIEDGAEVGAGTFGEGSGGTLTVNATDIEVIGTGNEGKTPSALRSSASENSKGNAGEVKITTTDMLIRDGAFVAASTDGAGNGGDLTIEAQDLEIIGFGGENPGNNNLPYFSGLFTSADKTSTRGNAGDLTIDTTDMLVEGGALVAANTFSEGNAGNLTVNADNVQLIGTGDNNEFETGLFARVVENATGNAGIITLNAPSISLDNKAAINASTQSVDSNPQQATINIIDARDLILRNGSNIFTNAEGAEVEGGNININSGVIAAFENSDITANSALGRGGNITIETQGIFGTQVREKPTSESDITATGANELLVGNIEINGIVQNPVETSTELPTAPVEGEFYDACQVGAGENASEFYIVGTGGIAPSPLDLLQEESVDVGWVSLPDELEGGERVEGVEGVGESVSQTQNSKLGSIVRKMRQSQNPNRIVEATGWAVDENGDILFVAQASPQSAPSFNNASCVKK